MMGFAKGSTHPSRFKVRENGGHGVERENFGDACTFSWAQ
jgi:hypothetical protein